MKHLSIKIRVAGITAGILGLCLASLSVRAATTVYFNQPVDKRFAWLGNDAKGNADFRTELKNLIASAGTSIDVCTMSFGGIDDVADALADAARKGRKVRIIGNSAHRYSDDYFRSLRGPIQLADNNLPALVCRINFQKSSHPVPDGFLADYGNLYPHQNGSWTYGWKHDATGDIQSTTQSGLFTSLLGDYYAKPNSAGPMTWEIDVPNGYYYVLAATGEADHSSKSFVSAQGGMIFTYISNHCHPVKSRSASIGYDLQ